MFTGVVSGAVSDAAPGVVSVPGLMVDSAEAGTGSLGGVTAKGGELAASGFVVAGVEVEATDGEGGGVTGSTATTGGDESLAARRDRSGLSASMSPELLGGVILGLAFVVEVAFVVGGAGALGVTGDATGGLL